MDPLARVPQDVEQAQVVRLELADGAIGMIVIACFITPDVAVQPLLAGTLRAAGRRPRAAGIFPLGLRRESVARPLEVIRGQDRPRPDVFGITPLAPGDPLA